MKKCTFRVPSDIALIKYWGKKDPVERLPENGSISFVLDGLHTTTTVKFDAQLKKDKIKLNDQQVSLKNRQAERVITHLDRVRAIGKSTNKAQVVSENNFPTGTGLSSSGSGFAALTLAAAGALELELSKKETSILARQASGSACRVVNGGFVEWYEGYSSETSYAESIFSASYWDLRDVIAIVDETSKKTTSAEGHSLAQSSKFFATRQETIDKKLAACRKYIKNKNFSKLGKLIEAESLEFHSIIFTSNPPLNFWKPGTVAVMQAVQDLRVEGYECYYTINTGFNVHVITVPQHEEIITERLGSLPLVQETISTQIGTEPEELTNHLF